jgi:cbb3-type cytochrome oxidase subunit 3
MSQTYENFFICGSVWAFDPNRRTNTRDIIEHTSRKDILNEEEEEKHEN